MITRWQLRLLGLVVLVVGLVSAGLIFWSGGSPPTPSNRPIASADYDIRDFERSSVNSKKAARELEAYYGQFGLVIAKWSNQLEDLKQPRPFAVTLATLSILAGSGCFVAARRWLRR